MSKNNVFHTNILEFGSQTIELLKNSLNNNKVSITSTDTLFGLLGNITLAAFNKLNTIKLQRENKPYLILIKSKDKLHEFVDSEALKNPNLIQLIDKCWPGPLTIIFKAKTGLPSFLTSDTGTIALRCPKHNNLQKLLEHFDGLFSTSANQSNKPTPTKIENISPEILKKIDYLVVDRESYLEQTLPSTLIDVSNKEIKIVRPGAFPVNKLEEFYGKKFKKSGEIK